MTPDTYPQRCGHWPESDAPGTYRVACSCGSWEATGTPEEVTAASRLHDDAPWRSHVVTVRERLS